LAFTAIITSFTIFKDAVKYLAPPYELDFLVVLEFFWYGLPQVLVWTFPMGVLLASLLAFGRLSANSEITAIRACGVSFGRILLPLVFASWVLVCLTFIINEKVAPKGTSKALALIKNALIAKGIGTAEYNISYFDAEDGWMFGAAEGDGKTFNDVILIDFNDPEKVVIYVADSAHWSPSAWEFQEVYIQGFSLEPDKPTWTLNSPSSRINFTRTPSQVMYEGKDPEQMSLQELRDFIKQQVLDDVGKAKLKQLWTKYHIKISAPFSCLIFVLISAPLGMNPQRGSSTVGMGLSMILVFIYYAILTASIKAGEGGALSPVIAAWFPNIIFFIAGLWLNARYYWSYGR
jgi:lipopolysaccharide export system permease protein